MIIEGTALKYGNNIDTDVIIPGKYTKTLDMRELAAHVLEDLDPGFRRRLTPGGFLVAGCNFGCGSSREQAPLALKHAGVGCVVAKSFARIFYRNAINIGLPLVECDTEDIVDGDPLRYDAGEGTLCNLRTGATVRVRPLPQIMVEILTKGGLIGFLKASGGYRELP
ncbi:MAG: 3-isopropylmalate dehydratase small subunit [Ignavibacteriales bacterium]